MQGLLIDFVNTDEIGAADPEESEFDPELDLLVQELKDDV